MHRGGGSREIRAYTYTVYRLPLSMYIQNNTAYYSGATLCIAYYTVLFIIRYCICIVYCSTLLVTGFEVRGGLPGRSSIKMRTVCSASVIMMAVASATVGKGDVVS